MQSNFYFLLSGENPDLAAYEFHCILQTVGIVAEPFFSSDNRIAEVSLESTPDTLGMIHHLLERVTMTHFGCEQLFHLNFDTILSLSVKGLLAAIPTTILRHLSPDRTFAVRVNRIGELEAPLHERNFSVQLSQKLGSLIQSQNPGKPVNLTKPDELYQLVISPHGMWGGLFIEQTQRKAVRERNARTRPFFHPSAMNPILQRTMLNLALVRQGEWLLDPFCGTGGGLLEAARMGIRSIGIEIDRRILWGATQNLRAYPKLRPLIQLIFGDALHVGLKKESIRAIVTDPPYGTAASTQGRDLTDLLLQFFQFIRPMLHPKCRIVIAMPSHITIEQQVAQILNATYRVFYQYVHRSLTRKILVYCL